MAQLLLAGRRSRRRRPMDGGRFAVIALLPSIILFAVFGILPAYNLLRMSVSDVALQGGVFTEVLVGFGNFAKIPSDQTGARTMVNTLVFSLASVVLTVGLGLALALLVERSRVFAGLARRVLLIPLAIAPVVISVIWLLIVDPNIGSLNKLLGNLGLPVQSWLGDGASAMAVVIGIDVWHWTPLVFLILFTSLQALDPEVREAALVDGANSRQTLRYITLPLVMPMVIALCGIRLLMSIKAFDEMFLVTGGGPGDATSLVSLHIRQVFFDELNLGYGSAYSVMVVLAIGALVAIGFGLRRLRRARAAS
ncbi:MAG: sugar transporter permease [Glaciihabitans sp.]|nr:sugar transporter permease [Glaciihabitans sp.]